MNKVFIACIVVIGILVFDAEGAPILPVKKLCSIQANGTAFWESEYDSHNGTVVVKRVNGVVIYSFTTQKTPSDKAYYFGNILLRPDLEAGAHEFCDYYTPIKRNQECGLSRFNDTFSLKKYKYSSEFNPVPGLECYCFVYYKDNQTAAMLFSADEKMNLIGEWFSLEEGTENFTFLYNNVEDYEHNTIDDVFSIKDFTGEFATNASTALTYLCNEDSSSSQSDSESASVNALSFIVFIAVMMVYILF